MRAPAATPRSTSAPARAWAGWSSPTRARVRTPSRTWSPPTSARTSAGTAPRSPPCTSSPRSDGPVVAGRLRRVSCSAPGLTRRRRGKGFVYLDAGGRRVDDPATLERIRALVIPPAWEDVWICPVASGHIQATGVDARGRRQYRYHDAWRLQRDLAKHDRTLDFASRLRAARDVIRADLQIEGLSRERVL